MIQMLTTQALRLVNVACQSHDTLNDFKLQRSVINESVYV